MSAIRPFLKNFTRHFLLVDAKGSGFGIQSIVIFLRNADAKIDELCCHTCVSLWRRARRTRRSVMQSDDPHAHIKPRQEFAVLDAMDGRLVHLDAVGLQLIGNFLLRIAVGDEL